MWKALKAVNESHGHQTVINYIHTLFHCTAEEDADIPRHLDLIKETWERINILGSEHFQISNLFFKIIIALSLPPSWDPFTKNYIGNETSFLQVNPKRQMSSQEFIGVIMAEYAHRKTRRCGTLKLHHTSTPLNYTQRTTTKNKVPLLNRISQRLSTSQTKENEVPCRLCKKTSHKTYDCPHWDDIQCEYCHKPGHREDDCWNKHKKKWPNNIGNRNKSINPNKRSRCEEAHEGDDAKEEGEEIVLQSVAKVVLIDTPLSIAPWNDDLIDIDKTQNKENLLGEETEVVSLGECADEDIRNYVKNSIIATGNQDRSLYNWIVDSTSTSHICNKWEVFIEYKPEKSEVPIYGVRNITAHAIGQGKVIIQAVLNSKTHKIMLNDILHVPHNRHNILSLGRWAHAGGNFEGGPEIMLIFPNATKITKGTLIANNLYKIRFRYYYSNPNINHSATQQYNFVAQGNELTWEAWHKCFGHVSYTGLTKLHSQKLINGFHVVTTSPKPECPACIAMKQSQKPFRPPTARTSHPGELTHADLWGKYDTTSINRSQYYLLLIDDATRYITVKFLKNRNHAAQQIQNYFTHLSVQDKYPCAIRVDRGTEFINQDLISWCKSRGIDIQWTAPYSPSQNGVAKQMNCTLVELACTMVLAAKLPEFLWEPAVEHATYIRNRSFTTSIQGTTPYEVWHGHKPDVTHLCEFGAPVWILLQGQKIP